MKCEIYTRGSTGEPKKIVAYELKNGTITVVSGSDTPMAKSISRNGIYVYGEKYTEKDGPAFLVRLPLYVKGSYSYAELLDDDGKKLKVSVDEKGGVKVTNG